VAAKKEDTRVKAGGAYWGPGEGGSAAEAVPTTQRSTDSKDYVLVTTYPPGADGLRIEEQVLKSDLEKLGLSMDSPNVREAHPAANQPTSGLTEEEIEQEGRTLG
jgi:hypothetical protein